MTVVFYEECRFGDIDLLDCFQAQNLSFGLHLHRCYELIYVIDGSIIVNINGSLFELIKDYTAIMLPNDIHSYITPEHSTVLICLFSPDLVTTFHFMIANKIPETPVFHCTDNHLLFLMESFSFIKKTDILNLKSDIYKLCSILYQNLSFKENNQTDKALLKNIVTYIQENFTENISLHQISAEFGYDYYYLSRYINKHIGIPFKHFINEHRINYAQSLLKNTDMSISCIALKCGFDNIRSFNRAFLRIMKTDPSVYRKAVKRAL